MVRSVTILLLLLAVPSSGLAVALLAGIGVLHHAPPILLALSAAMLVGLPAAGIGTLARGQVIGALSGLIVWSWMIIAGFPLYFPGERVDALAAGIGVVSAPLRVQLDPTDILVLESLLPAMPEGQQPLPRLAPIATAPPQLFQDEAGGVVVRYAGQGQAMSVPVTLEGADGHAHEVWMLFDTGATLTTLDRATLARLGVTVSEDAPEVSLRTAAGERTAQTLILDRLSIGSLQVEGVTIAVCDACADEDTVGLLGLNVSGRFRLTLDATARELALHPRERVDNSVDLSPWVDVQATATRWSDGRIEVEVTAESRAPRPVSDLTVEIRCDQTFAAELGDLPPGGQVETRVALPLGADCAAYSVAMVSGRW